MFTVVTVRYNNETWEASNIYRNKKNIACIYASPCKLAENIDLNSPVFVIEMNNSTNQIIGIGLIKNKLANDKVYKVQDNSNYNRYIYIGEYHISRDIMDDYNSELVYVLEEILFKGYTPEVGANNLINIADPTFAYSNLNAGFFKGNLIANQATSDGFYGKTTTNLLNLYPSHSYNTVGDQYIIVDPTAPNHIHLRAGGAIDSSNAELFLGGENTSVQVSDNAKEVYITANGKSSTFNNNGTVTLFGKVTANGLNLNDFSQAAFNKANSAIFNSGGDLTVGTMLIGAGGNNLTTLANTGTAGTYANASHVPVFTTDAYGRVSAVTNTAISIDTSQITSGTLGYGRGGTGSTSYTTGALLVAGASGLTSLANSSYTLTGALQANNTVTSLTVDVYGRVTAATGTAISGLTVPQGGTGLSSVTTNGITYGNGSGNLGVTAAAGSADQTWSNQILTVTNAGVPVWTTTLDGGTF
jgi:hypothetical protein